MVRCGICCQVSFFEGHYHDTNAIARRRMARIIFPTPQQCGCLAAGGMAGLGGESHAAGALPAHVSCLQEAAAEKWQEECSGEWG